MPLWLRVSLRQVRPTLSPAPSRRGRSLQFGKGDEVEKLPFTSFDFWGYLAAGFLLLCAVDAAAGTQLLARPNWTVIEGIFAASVAYVTGHVVAGLSSLLIERGLVGKVLGWPSANLFGQSKASGFPKWLLGFYFGTLPAETQKAVLDKATPAGVSAPGEALFWLAFAKARGSDRTMGRLNDFLNQYSFCRNVATVAFIDAAILNWSYLQPKAPESHIWWSRIAFFIGVALLLRYLKFLRHYSLELFTAYAHAEEPKAKAP
jgi:hypothetical protein